MRLITRVYGITCSLENMYSVGIWTLGLMNTIKYHGCETSLLSQAVLEYACDVQRFHLQEVCARNRFCIMPRMKKSMALFHIKIFMSCYITFLQHVGHKWVICGSYLDCSVGQWVKWANRCDPLSTLFYTIIACMLLYSFRTRAS